MNRTAVLTTIPSDSHSWNLVFLQMFLEEQGFQVVNLGICAPLDLLVEAVDEHTPDLVVVSTVNGHGYIQGIEIAQKIAPLARHDRFKLVIGGKLGTDTSDLPQQAAKLVEAGFDDVFYGPQALSQFADLLAALPVEAERNRESAAHAH
jgi:methylaspartate mutase sigma subunit